MSNEQIGAAILGFGAAFFVGLAILYVMYVVAYWKIFTKAGESGWKSLIPCYNTYIQYKLTWKPYIFWVLLVATVVTGVLKTIENPGTVVTVIGAVLSVVILVLNIMTCHKLSKAFGHGAGFTVGLVLLQPIFILVLGLGSSQYIGNTTDMKSY